MAKRTIIQTIRDGAGNVYHIPPRKKRKFSKNIVMRFVIPGTIPSKKNCTIPSISWNRIESILKPHIGKIMPPTVIDQIKAVKPFIRNSNRYLKWEQIWMADVALQADRWHKAHKIHGISFPVTKATITIYHYWKDDISRDNGNKAESIHDMLVRANILSNDDHQCLYKNVSEGDLYQGETLDHLTIFTITAHEW